jgi:hypothetical protein
MPVRVIKKIEAGYKGDLHIPLPSSILHVYELNEDSDVLVCEFRRHFGKDKKLIRDINAPDRLRVNLFYNEIKLADSAVVREYGLVKDEYIEIIFNAIERKRYESGGLFRKPKIKLTTIPIFPGRTVEDLDFTPE